MRSVGRITIVFVVIACCVATEARADLQDITPVEGAIILVAVGAVLTTSVVNIVQIAQGDGSKFWGWAGIGMGSCIVAVFVGNPDPWTGSVVGGLVAGLGLWSLLLATGNGDHEEKSSGINIAPTLSYTRDEGMQPGIAATLRF